MFRDVLSNRLLTLAAFISIILTSTTPVLAGDAILSWDPPTTNADGTSLTDLAGYKIYYGNSSGNYTVNIDVGNTNTYQINNLTEGLTYYFAVTAYDTSGNESEYSNESSKTISAAVSPVPDITASDSMAPNNDQQIPFGEITEGSSSDQTVTITNDGNTDLVIGTVAQNNSVVNPFGILNDQCSGQTLPPASACTFTVRFSPSSTGLFSDSFDIPSNDSDENPVTVSLSGTGGAIPVPDITTSDSMAPNNDQQIPFGEITEGSSSDQTVTITNDGNADLVIGTVAQNNSVVNPFGILNDQCSGQTLPPASACTFTVRFSPSSTGLFSDSFDIPSNDSDENPVTVSLSGTGGAIPVPDITTSDSMAPNNDQQIPFGEITEGSSSDQTVTITNDGNADLVIGTVAQNNSVVNPFGILNDQCSGQTLPPASACTFTVRFSPSSTGLFSDSFDIPSNDSDENPVTINLSGAGIVQAASDITVTDSIHPSDDNQLPFGELTEGLTLNRLITITNDGNANLLIGNIAQNNPVVNPFSILDDQCSQQTLSPASVCTFTVRFSPSSTGLFSDSFDIPSNDSDENPVTVDVSGKGLPSISNNPPSTPKPVFPANNQKGLGNKIIFRWTKAADPDGNPVTYTLYICEDQNLTSGCISAQNIAYLKNTNVYYASIGNYAGLLTFLIIPAIINLVRYKTKKTLTIIIIMLFTITFFTACGGGGAGGSGGVIESGNSPLPSNNNEVSHSVLGLHPGTTYYWKVIVQDSNGGQSESGVYSFETQ